VGSSSTRRVRMETFEVKLLHMAGTWSKLSSFCNKSSALGWTCRQIESHENAVFGKCELWVMCLSSNVICRHSEVWSLARLVEIEVVYAKTYRDFGSHMSE
jgi:hypothetical protein